MFRLDEDFSQCCELCCAQGDPWMRLSKGVGPSATHTLLIPLGRCDELASDAELRAFMRGKNFKGKASIDREIRALYADWERWRYLAYRFDLVADSQGEQCFLRGIGDLASVGIVAVIRPGLLLPFVVSMGFGAVAAYLHVAPPAAAVASRIQE